MKNSLILAIALFASVWSLNAQTDTIVSPTIVVPSDTATVAPEQISFGLNIFGLDSLFTINLPYEECESVGNSDQALIGYWRVLFPQAFNALPDTATIEMECALAHLLDQSQDVKAFICGSLFASDSLVNEMREYEFSFLDLQLLGNENTTSPCDSALVYWASQLLNDNCLQTQMQSENYDSLVNVAYEALLDTFYLQQAVGLYNPSEEDMDELTGDTCRVVQHWLYTQQLDTLNQNAGLDSLTLANCHAELLEAIGEVRFNQLAPQERDYYCANRSWIDPMLLQLGYTVAEGLDLVGFGSNCWLELRGLLHIFQVDSLTTMNLVVGGGNDIRGALHAKLGVQLEREVWQGATISIELGAEIAFNAFREPAETDKPDGSAGAEKSGGGKTTYGTDLGESVNEIAPYARFIFNQDLGAGFYFNAEVFRAYYGKNQTVSDHGHDMLSIGYNVRTRVGTIGFRLWGMPYHKDMSGIERKFSFNQEVVDNSYASNRIFGFGMNYSPGKHRPGKAALLELRRQMQPYVLQQAANLAPRTASVNPERTEELYRAMVHGDKPVGAERWSQVQVAYSNMQFASR